MSPRITAPAKRVPDFFIVGHPKCGTSALYEMLRRQPRIHMPIKEPWFFSPEKRGRSENEGSVKNPETLDGYLSLFGNATPEQLIGEATPSYLLSQHAAARIAEVQPDARIIALLREPASFLRSFHLQAVENHTEGEGDLRRAIALEEVRREQKSKGIVRRSERAYVYSELVRYVEQLRRYHAVFAPEQVLVLIYEDFRGDNEATVRRVLRFLGVDEVAPIEAVEANPSVRVRAPQLHELLRSVYLGRGAGSRALKGAIKAVAPRRLRHDALGTIRRRVIYGEPLPADEGLMRELRRRFKHEVVALSEYLDRDLVTSWGYDEAALRDPDPVAPARR